MAIDMERMEKERDAVLDAHDKWVDASKRLAAHKPGAMTVIGQINRNYQKALQRWDEYCKLVKAESGT